MFLFYFSTVHSVSKQTIDFARGFKERGQDIRVKKSPQ